MEPHAGFPPAWDFRPPVYKTGAIECYANEAKFFERRGQWAVTAGHPAGLLLHSWQDVFQPVPQDVTLRTPVCLRSKSGAFTGTCARLYGLRNRRVAVYALKAKWSPSQELHLDPALI